MGWNAIGSKNDEGLGDEEELARSGWDDKIMMLKEKENERLGEEKHKMYIYMMIGIVWSYHPECGLTTTRLIPYFFFFFFFSEK